MYRVRMMVEEDAWAAVETALELVESAATFWRDDDYALAWVETFGTTEADALAAAGELRATLAAGGVDLDVRLTAQQIEDRDWQEAWQAHVHPLRVSEHIIVAPSWGPCEPPEGVHVLRIDPGMSFGHWARTVLRNADGSMRMDGAAPAFDAAGHDGQEV